MDEPFNVSHLIAASNVFNIQLKYKDVVPKLLEIDPRTSRGFYISCLSEVNVSYQTIKFLLTGTIEPPYSKLGIKATHIEKAVVLSKEPQQIVI